MNAVQPSAKTTSLSGTPVGLATGRTLNTMSVKCISHAHAQKKVITTKFSFISMRSSEMNGRKK